MTKLETERNGYEIALLGGFISFYCRSGFRQCSDDPLSCTEDTFRYKKPFIVRAPI